MENKKIAALTGALYYLKERREEQERTAACTEAPARESPWAQYGRQNIMQMRALVQRRVLRR